jgi:hypothetical protein
MAEPCCRHEEAMPFASADLASQHRECEGAMRAPNPVRLLALAALGLATAEAAAQSPADCSQILSETPPFEIEFSDGGLAQISRRPGGETVVLIGRKGAAEALSRQWFKNGYLVRLETKGSTVAIDHEGDLSRNPYEARRSFVAKATRHETRSGVTRSADPETSNYQFLGDDRKVVGACPVDTMVFEATQAGRCGDKAMPQVVHHYSLELRTSVSSSGQFCRNGEYAPFSRKAVAIRLSFAPFAF